MVNSYSIFNLSNGVTSNWCIKLDAKFMLALTMDFSRPIPTDCMVMSMSLG